MKYFRESENPTARLPQNFMQSFLEVSYHQLCQRLLRKSNIVFSGRVGIED